MTSIILLLIAALTIVLDFVGEFQKPEESILPTPLRTPRARLWVRSILLVIALVALGLEQKTTSADRDEAKSERAATKATLTKSIDLQAQTNSVMTALFTQFAQFKQRQLATEVALASGEPTHLPSAPNGNEPILNTYPHGLIDFGAVSVGSDPVQRVFGAVNIGTGQCAVDVSIIDKIGSHAFEPSRPHIKLAAKTPQAFSVAFHPLSPGPYEAALRIQGTPPCSFDNPTLKGTGR
jgi:hypothetical protein